jgi:pilus assembly protein CpaB
MPLPKPNRTAVILIVAVVVGIGTMFFARRYIDTAVRGQIKREATLQVVVAARDLPKGATVSPQTMQMRAVPAEWVQSQSVLPEQFERARDMKLAYPLKAGEMLLWPAVEDPNNISFSARVAPGRRALTVPVDEVSSISGMLEPGDQIDLYVTLQRENDKRQVLPVLQGVSVLAAGNRTVTSAETGRTSTYSTITLDVSPNDAEVVTLARQAGSMNAMLRNPDDAAKSPPPANLLALLGGYVASQKPRGPGRPGVQILYGNRQLPDRIGGLPPDPEIASMERLSTAIERLSQSPPAAASSAAAPTSSAPQLPPVMAAMPAASVLNAP